MTLVLYDIPEDSVRRKVSEVLRDYGLQRTQFSAFAGRLSTNRRQEMMLCLAELLEQEHGNIQIYSISERDLALMVEIDPSGYAARAYR